MTLTPKQEARRTDLEYTLAWVNERRGEMGLGSLKGLPRERGDDHRCPVELAIPDAIVSRKAWVLGDWHFNDPGDPLPFHVARFVRSFDAGRYPELAYE